MAAFASSYIKTVASQVTRAADAASMTGANFSSWYNRAEGTIFADINGGFGAFAPVLTIDDNSGSNRFYAYRNSATPNTSTAIRIDGTANGSSILSAFGPANGADGKFSLSYKSNDFAAVLNAGTVATDSDGNVPLNTQLSIGYNQPANRYWGGTIKKLAFYPKRIANAQLQGLTS
jgi:hypothetical protein